ncbi:SgcJ/EcaC family oxidoreductase [Kineosporia succinea]|uniref:Uncharacterized protein (TIGR02246 family) n=1 Tax=Kineosporia succinea TaxID=84632 RepID=A0ABT9PCB0_9ACTN|nr:SgcJ/EcaC family oxidoreductase [Kineosporia succinea]MDP9830039.1 uncharacterized protein (TIGR02246 family) [Kineosporia succinea]
MEQSLAEIPARMTQAWNRGDAAAFFADFAPDARLVEFEGTVVEGRDTLVRGQQPMFDTVLKGSRLVDGTVLFAQVVAPGVGIVHHRATLMMAGETQKLPTRVTMQLYVAHRRDERWEVVALQNGRVLSLENSFRLDAGAA